MNENSIFYLLFVAFILLIQSQFSYALSAMAIDLGSEFIKVAVVSPGVPMEVALDSDSSRKTPTVITLRNDERLFGSAALNMAVKFPDKGYIYIPNLIGKTKDHPDVQRFMTNFPSYNIRDDPESGQLVFAHDSKTEFTAEELLAMLFEKAKETAVKHTGFSMKAAVITVPPYFSQASRRAILRAARLADINVLQLLNENTAVALNYGAFRFNVFNATPQYFMFYDLGANGAIASVVEYRTVLYRPPGTNLKPVETPQLSVLGMGYDSELGTVALGLRLRDYLAKQFKKDVRGNHRAMARLYREALRVIKVLSANQETFAQVENVMDETDLKVAITRSQFEELCADLFLRVALPVRQALSMSKIPLSSIQEVVLMGGGTRIPKVQEELSKATERQEVSKGINADEAGALGAVYQAAYLTPGFRVKHFLIKDGNAFPIQVSFYRAEKDKTVTRTLFNLMNTYPQKKSLTFNKLQDDFSFYVHLGELEHLPPSELLRIHTNLSSVHVEGVAEAYKKHLSILETAGAPSPQLPTVSPLQVEAKGIKAHFELDVNGLLKILSVEALFEKSQAAIDAQKEKEQSTFAKIGSKISSFFSSTEKEASPPEKESENTVPADNITPTNTTEGAAPEQKEGSAKPVESKEATQKSVIISEPLQFHVVYHDAPNVSEEYMKKSGEKICKLQAADEAKRALEKSRNELESYIFNTKDRLTHSIFEKCSTAEERESLEKLLQETNDWYDEQGMETTIEDFDNKLNNLKNALKEIDFRIDEYNARPSAIAKLNELLNTSQMFYDSMLNFTGDNQIFTAAETDLLGKLINGTKAWLQSKMHQIETMILYQKPIILVEDINDRSFALQRELQSVLAKINLWKTNPPPPPPPPPSSEPKPEKAETKEKEPTDKEQDESSTSRESDSSSKATKDPQHSEL